MWLCCSLNSRLSDLAAVSPFPSHEGHGHLSTAPLLFLSPLFEFSVQTSGWTGFMSDPIFTDWSVQKVLFEDFSNEHAPT